MFDSVGNLYGTTANGGANGAGVVFELSPVGAGWTETVLYSFCSQSGCTDGANPINGLIMDPAGNLYGTTSAGCGYGCGIVFELSPSDGGWTEQVIYAKGEVEGLSDGGLAMDAAGNIFCYAVAWVIVLSPNGNGGWAPTALHLFCNSEGCYLEGNPVIGKDGSLYVTTASSHVQSLSGGVIYKMSPGKKKLWTAKNLHTFRDNGKDGYYPYAGIVFDAAGNIYGTTTAGGKSGDGTVFELVALVGKGGYKEKILWNFNGTDGSQPYDSLILDSAGNLYGTTVVGGDYGSGVVFEVTP
jgi:uncharacterized repeat protein (TIGR03803 family)